VGNEAIKTAAQRGNAALEFALSFVLIWTLLAGMYQFGYAMYVYASLASAVADGARYASHVEFDAPAHKFVDKVKNMTVYGNTSGTGGPLAPGLSTSQVGVIWATDALGVPQTITVRISSYTVRAMRSYTYINKPRLTVKFVGPYTTPGPI